MKTLPRVRLAHLVATFAFATANAAPVINEIMFHPPGENRAQEWIEIYNPDPVNAVNVSNWKFSKGITFTIPSGTTIQPNDYLVIAADVATFNADHPGFAGQVVGGWTGRLSNSGEQIQLDNAAGAKVNDVSYASEGEWALRGRGELSYSHRGWSWFSDADGGGRTLELRNPALGNGSGQNWGVSAALGGTPGAANSLASVNIAPLIKDVKHRPEIPLATDPIVVSCNLEDEAEGATATLHWRVDGAGAFNSLPMSDTDGDGGVEANIPAQANLAVIEFYISATDAGALSRTWPAPARTSDPGVLPETFGQVANALFQIDNSYDMAATFRTAADAPIYRLIMTNDERLELLQIGTTNGQEESAAEMNGTFISHDGTGVKTRYLVGFRNRGQGSALGPPNNYHVSFRSDDRWNGLQSTALNSRYGYLQALGQAVMARAGLATQDAAIVKVSVNGADLAEVGGRMYGRYARLEGRSSDWAEHHYPGDPDGNFYRLDDHDTGGTNPPGDLGSGEFRYEGSDPNAYSDTFIKETNKDAFDYSDLINFSKVVSAPATGGTAEQPAISDAAYPAAVAAVLDVEQFFRFIAGDALIGNMEGGMQSGRGDDASIYRGLIDTRFKFIPHDLDTTFDGGDSTGGVSRNIFSYDGGNNPGTGVRGLERIFGHPQIVPKYYAALLDACNTWFNNATLDPIIDQIMAGWVPLTDGVSANRSINDIKSFIATRRANVLAAIQQNYSLNVTVGGTTTPEGYQRTNDGSATFSGTFNVARTYSITVNGVLATANYRTDGGITAGTWSLAVAAGGGGVLHPGLNQVVVQFWDAPNGTGNVLTSLNALVLYQPTTATYTNVSGTLSAGSLRLIAPASYIPGKPFLVRVDLLDPQGNLNRTAWDTTVALSSSAAGVTLPSVQLFNGMGSVLCTAGGTGGGGTTILIQPGGTSGSPNASAPDWRMLDTGPEPAATWKSDQAFVDASWTLGKLQAGAGDSDERTALNNVPGSAGNTRRAFYFRRIFNVANPAAFTQLFIRAVVDDGAVIYLNGQEVYRDNMPGGTPALTTPASSNRSGSAETQIRSFDISAFLNLLVAGNNLLAVEVHNFSDNAPTYSADLSFDCQLDGIAPATDPGNFTLTASGAGFTAQKAMTSLGSSPTMTNVSGTLATGTTTWSGVIIVTGDVTVPAGGTLVINPGTHVLVAGTPFGGGGSAGADIIVAGALQANGTLASPISITAFNATDRWGELNFTSATPSTLSYVLANHACHSPGGGHTGTGPMIRLAGNTLTIDDSVFADSPGKIMTNTGNCTITVRRSHFARSVMGPELDGSGLTLQDSNVTNMQAVYRESGAQDDEDCIYIHNPGGRPVNIQRSVFSTCDDDAIDCLAGTITLVEDSIVRNAFDKGFSLLQNNITIRRCQIIDNDIGVSAKCQVGADEAVPYLTTLENCTIFSENHPTNTSDGSFHSVGVHTRNKYGTTTMNITMQLRNCIISAEQPVANDYGGGTFPLNVQNYTCFQDLGGTNPSDPLPTSGTGNITADPLYTSIASDNYRLTATSPCRDTGDPAMTDPDLTRIDMGALPYTGASGAAGTISWTPVGGPYRVTAATTVPAGITLSIAAGTAVYFDQNVRLTVNGRILAEGTPGQRITFSHVPGTNLASDVDPIKNGTQTGAPKWGGIRVYDSMAQENVFKYCDFINAQGTSPSGSENYGSLGHIRSWGFIEGCTWAGTHLRMCYGRNSKLTVFRNTFPDMFIFDPLLGRIEEPTTDFIGAADNNMEPLKVEFPTTDAEVSGNANYPNGLPLNGHWRCYANVFNGNRGHQDVFDCDSGRWAPRDASGNQTNGQFVIDCRYNHFRGRVGDEHMDLGGDAYIASNIFENARKDYWTNDTGYSSAISSGDKGTGTTILLARNVCYDLDHVINLKASTATIFEHNTVANIHADFQFVGQTVTQNVVCAPINFFIPGDGASPTHGDGAYLGFNIISNVPHVFSGPDASSSGPITTKIEFNNNLLDQIADPVIGPNHSGGYFSGTYGPNTAGAPGFVNPANEDYSLRPDSLARSTTPGGFDYGASIAEWAYILGGPRDGSTTAATGASFAIGGPGLVAYKWRLDNGAWSAPIQIGDGGLFSRTQPCVRQATLNLSSLAAGPHTLEVLGQDMAGNWQDADPARTLIGVAQAAPTSRTWTVDAAFVSVRLHEILADSATLGDTVELQNIDSVAVNLTGWSLTDDPLVPAKLPLSGTVAAGGYATFSNALLAIDKDGDTIYLYHGGVLADSITFGQQITDKTLGRRPSDGAWALCNPTLGAVNVPIAVGDFSSVRISEWLASGDVLYKNDWIELQNAASVPVLLTGLRVTDNRAGDASAYTFPPLSFIAAGGYVRLIADGNTTPGHTSFKLDAEYENVTLLNTDGTVLDTVLFYPQTTDYSMGRDAGGALTFYELPTRGFLNGTTDPGYANALAILRGLRITEIMYNAIGGSNFDYVELRNVGPTPLALGGVKFASGIDFTFPAMTLNPGEYVIVAKHLASFRARYGDTPLVAGVYSGNLDNGGEGISIQLPPPFDANALTFDYEDGWYPSTDGLGPSLLIVNGNAKANTWGDRESWTFSANGGNPSDAAVRTDTYSGFSAINAVQSITEDRDRDSIGALVEFSLGQNITNPNQYFGVAGLPVVGRDGAGRGTLTFFVPEVIGAAQSHGYSDVTYRVQAADILGTWTTIATKTFAANWTGTATVAAPAGGYVQITITDTAAFPTPRFLRLQVNWTP